MPGTSLLSKTNVRRSILAAVLLGAVLVAAKIGLVRNALQGEDAGGEAVAAAPYPYLLRDYAPTFGAADARVVLVEFLDPACEGCARFHPRVKAILDAYPGQVKLVVRHLPFHPGAELAVKALEASREQGKYWETLSALLGDQRAWASGSRIPAERIMRFLDGLPLDHQRLRSDIANPEYERRLAVDLEDAKAAGVRQTPQFFINGKPLAKFGLAELDAAIATAVKSAYP